ncbi:MAG: hypothetical protein EOO88_45135 [Pedobacter sp.]|nr:MAG: hypothetical protein EOO88_45135 [Pedobacter sp.]
MYFFNSYQATLKASGQDTDKKQTFYINNGQSVTAKEAYNLLEGRSVSKELMTRDGNKYQAWLQLDFESKDKNNNYEVQQYHERYGYDLEKTLKDYPIKEMDSAEKKSELLGSLQRGNSQIVTMQIDKQDIKYYIDANPRYKTINVRDQQFNPVKREDLVPKTQLPLKDKRKIGAIKEAKNAEKKESQSLKV